MCWWIEVGIEALAEPIFVRGAPSMEVRPAPFNGRRTLCPRLVPVNVAKFVDLVAGE